MQQIRSSAWSHGWVRTLLTAIATAAILRVALVPAAPLGRGGGDGGGGDGDQWDGRCKHNVAFIESHPKCKELEARAAAGEVHERYWISPSPPPPSLGSDRCKHNPIFIATHPKCAYLEALALEQAASREVVQIERSVAHAIGLDEAEADDEASSR